MLTGSLDSQSKLKQLRALRGKLRDGTIRGKSSIQAAKLEIERLESELKISSEEESSAMEFGKDGDETSRLDAAAPDMLDRRVDPVMSTNTVSMTMGYSRDEFERRSSQNGESIYTLRKLIMPLLYFLLRHTATSIPVSFQ